MVLTPSRTDISRLASGITTVSGLDIIVLLDPAVIGTLQVAGSPWQCTLEVVVEGPGAS